MRASPSSRASRCLPSQPSSDMSLSPALAALAGRWSGDNAVWLEPGADPLRSSASAEVSLEAEGQALRMRYLWADGGKPQSGTLLLVGDATLTAWAGAWTDSWHLAHQLMDCRGSGDGNSVSVRGTYAAPPGPDWGWRLATYRRLGRLYF
ncbi:MAG: hypothetical protein C0497_14080 [Gemmatimonas sp.]|nr:hypothetical protein [Gemmatimonas sp.]